MRPIAMLEATSPPACPPMPSATTNRFAPEYPESWLLERTFPVWEIAALEPSKTIWRLRPYARSSKVVAPTLMELPICTWTGLSLSRWPSRNVPLVEPRSCRVQMSPRRVSRAWWLEV